jgi:tetratricopeptide (TPR) repeat protein/SAM-dependent methyltransferase
MDHRKGERRAVTDRTSRRAEEAARLHAEGARAHQAGRLDIAEGFYRRALDADPNHTASLHHLGILALQTGHGRAAVDLIRRAVATNESLPEPHYSLGVALQGEGRLDEAAARYRRAIALKPDHAAAHMNLGNILTQQGRLTDAAACYERVLALDPRSAAAHYNLANVLARDGRLGEAEERYRAAIACNAGFAEAYNNLGNVLKDQGRLGDAEQAYRQALALRSDYADAHNNLGVVRSLGGAVENALTHFAEAVRLRPDFLDAHKNLGLALSRCGRSEAAVEHLKRALSLKPDDLDAAHYLACELLALGRAVDAVSLLRPLIDRNGTVETKSLFAHCLQALRGDEVELARDHVVRALREGWVRGGELEHLGIALVKRTATVAACIARLDAALRSEPGPTLDPGDLEGFAADPLLHQLMISGRVSDEKLEAVLTAARRALLDAASRGQGSAHLDFFAALARQCFIDEYVFAESAEERRQADDLAARLTEALRTGGSIAPLWPVAVGAYMPLHSLPDAEALLARAWPASVAQVLAEQIRQPMEERTIRAALPALTEIDADSLNVQSQYEENPYPRWVIPPPAIAAHTVNDYLRAKYPLASFGPVAAPDGPDVLIAGCGSGSHAIEAHRRFAGARILAVDLSRASLAYAVRKTRELDLPIEYAQADILKLGALARRFDVIEASGSLQCLKAPAVGWRVLLSLLKPGGVMTLGLYSQIARQDINSARAYVAAKGYGGSAAEIRRCRQEILAFPAGAPGRSVAEAGDFYSMSDCRDLLFHVQEYQHTLPEIAAFIAEENLRFLGFQLDARVLRAYAARFPDDRTMTDLASWHAFECEHPDIFAGMYQFTVQKP